MEVSAFKHPAAGGVPARLAGRSPLLRLQSDERLVVLTRRGSHGAFEALVARYQSRLLAFCRHMLASREDAEDVLQEVFAAAFNALMSDDRPINVRPWLYRIARNRCLNHLRRATAIGVDSMDVHYANHGQTTADQVHEREEFRQLLGDVRQLPETQRTALLLREIDALSYEQIAEAMDTTVPSVKSLLVRARVSLAEAGEARKMTCDEVRLELGEWAEGLSKISAPVRRHLKTCSRCSSFRHQLKETNRALAAVLPVGPLLLLKKLAIFSFGSHAASGGGAAGGAAAGGAISAAGGAAAGGAGAGIVSAGLGAVASKVAAGLTAAAIVTAGAVEVDHADHHRTHHRGNVASAAAPAQPAVAAPAVPKQTVVPVAPVHHELKAHKAVKHDKPKAKAKPVAQTTAPTTKTTTAAQPPAPKPTTTTPTSQTVSETTTLPTTTPSTTSSTTTTCASPPATTTPPPTTTTTEPTPPPPTTTTTPPPGSTTPTPPPPTTSTTPTTTTTPASPPPGGTTSGTCTP
jgi:RNA polymerase sigma factor (sigma-70 family)